MVTKLHEVQILKKIFWYLVLIVVANVVSYGFLINKTVYNVAEREKMESEISDLNSKMGEIEFKYISLKNSINPEYARSLGFKDVQSQEFISRNTEIGKGLSMKVSN